jgi:four helix bundle protein
MRDLQERLLTFSISIILFLRKVPFNEEYKIIKRQLIRSSTSAGANYEESQGGYSRADFSFKVATSLKEMRESVYWLKIL